ncbi:hypothetical protein FGI60_21575 [Brucella haematophila]|nr:hypothetical protein FGI60_21575 [Brucella haematophila]
MNRAADKRKLRIDRAVPSEPLYPFVFTHYPTQNRFALLLEMLLNQAAGKVTMTVSPPPFVS